MKYACNTLVSTSARGTNYKTQSCKKATGSEVVAWIELAQDNGPMVGFRRHGHDPSSILKAGIFDVKGTL
jgi:hypothetical protein